MHAVRAARRVLVAALLLAGTARAEVFDRVAAVVEDQPVLASEVALHDALAPLDLDASPFWLDHRRPALERLIDGAVVRLAAADVALYQPPDEDVLARREAIRARFRDRRTWEEFLAAHGLTEDTLAALLRRRMVVERYLERNVHASLQDRAAWWSAADRIVDDLRARMRVRVIQEER